MRKKRAEAIEVKIEKNIPIPLKRAMKSAYMDVVKKMGNGDSVVIKGATIASTLCASIRKAGKFASQRRVSEGEYRVWCFHKERK